MTPAELRTLTAAEVAPLSPVCKALWAASQGEWNDAHEVVQALATREAAWVHAFLHRQEGDVANAAYWYRRAGKPVATGPLDDEWNVLADAALA